MAPEVLLLGSVTFSLPPEAPGGPKPSTVLALLALAAGTPVTDTALVEAVWDAEPPESAEATLQAYISRLRKMCASRGLQIDRENRGYRLAIAPTAVDSHLLADRIAQAERTSSPTARAEVLQGALGLLGEEPLSGCVETPAIVAARRRLAAVQLTAVGLAAATAMTTDLELPAAAFRVADRSPAAETTQAALATMLIHRGRPEEARHRLEWVVDHVRNTLNAEPDRRILDLLADPTSTVASAGETRSTAPRPTTRQHAEHIGRTTERSLLRRAVTGDRSGAVLVTGAGGMGKTTLVRDALPSATWAPPPQVGDTPWPWIWSLLDIERPFVSPGTPLYETLETSTTTIVNHFRAAARPTVLIVDDLHARSPVSRLQFAALARQLPAAGLSLVGITRDSTALPRSGRFADPMAIAEIELTPLSARDAMTLVQAAAPIDDVLASRLVASAAGSPLLLSEGLRAIADDALEADVLAGRLTAAPDAVRRLLDLVALGGSADPDALRSAIDEDPDSALAAAIADGLLEQRDEHIAFSHDRLAEAARELHIDDDQRERRRRFAAHLLTAWDDQPHSAVSIAPVLIAADHSNTAIHAAAAHAHHLARDWSAAAQATEQALADEVDPIRSAALTHLAAERWVRAGDLWRARALLGPLIDDDLQPSEASAGTTPDTDRRFASIIEYISYGTTGFRIDDRIRAILETTVADDTDEATAVMLDAVRLTEARRRSIDIDPASIDPADLLRRARAVGDARAITWALGPSLVDALTSDAHRELRQLADELEANASGAEQSEVPVVAGWYRFEAANRRGDREGLERELAAIERRAETTMEVPNRWYAHTLRAGRALVAGELEQAERHLDIALELGTTSIGSEAMASYGAGLLFIRWFQDRTTELLGVAPPPVRGDQPLGAPVLGTIMGTLIRALVPGASVDAELTEVIPRATNTLELALIGEAAIATGHRSAADDILGRLRPEAPMVVMPAGFYVVAAESLRGRLLALVGQPDAARPALERGHSAELSAGAVLSSHRTALAHAAIVVESDDRSTGLRWAADTEHWARMNGAHALERMALELRTRASFG